MWTVGTLPAGTRQTLTIAARVTALGFPRINSNVSHSDQFDPNLGNNQAAAFLDPQSANLAVFKTVDNARPAVGSTVSFTVTVNNLGFDDATNVSVTDALPSGLTFVSSTPGQGSYDPTTGVWTVGTVSPNAAQTLVLMATVVGTAESTNTATITHADQFDPNPDNNSSSVTIIPMTAPPTGPSTNGTTPPVPPSGSVPPATLPVTGTDLTGPIGVAGTATLAGALLLVAARARRREVAHTRARRAPRS